MQPFGFPFAARAARESPMRTDYDTFTAVCMFALFVGWAICGGTHEADHHGATRAWCRWCHMPFACGTDGRPALLS